MSTRRHLVGRLAATGAVAAATPAMAAKGIDRVDPLFVDPHVEWELDLKALADEWKGIDERTQEEVYEDVQDRYWELHDMILDTPVHTVRGAAVQLQVLMEIGGDAEERLPDLPAQLEAMALCGRA